LVAAFSWFDGGRWNYPSYIGDAMNPNSFSNILLTVVVCIVFPVLIPVAILLAGYVAIAKTGSGTTEGPKD
jgi:hypothetical protein